MREEQEQSDYSTILTPDEKEQLFSHPHTNAFPLSDEQCRFLDEEGYLVVKKVIDTDICDSLVRQMFFNAKKYFGIVRDDPNTWNKIPSHGLLDFWHLPGQYDIRQNEKLYSIFAQICKTEKLVASIDRVSMKNPRTKIPTTKKQKLNGDPNLDLQLHTDINYWDNHNNFSLYSQFQCGICLEDCLEDCGGFYCLPKYHKSDKIRKYMQDCESMKFEKWKDPNNTMQFKPPNNSFVNYQDKEAIKAYKITTPLEKGDIVIWNNYLPHAGGKNWNPTHWRLQTFVRFLALDGPSVSEYDKNFNNNYRSIVEQSVNTGKPPQVFSTGGNRVNTKFTPQMEYKYPNLSDLGKKVLGVTSWD